jgi:hypothetical protein
MAPQYVVDPVGSKKLHISQYMNFCIFADISKIIQVVVSLKIPAFQAYICNFSKLQISSGYP